MPDDVTPPLRELELKIENLIVLSQRNYPRYWQIIRELDAYDEAILERGADDAKERDELHSAREENKKLLEKELQQQLEQSRYIDTINQQILALKEEIEKYYTLNELEKKHQEELARIKKIEDKFITPFIKGLDSLVDTSAIFHRAIEPLQEIGREIIKPIGLIVTGIMGFWHAFAAWRDNRIQQRKTKMGVGVYNFLAATAAVILFFLAAASPIVIFILGFSTVLTGLYASSYATHQARAQVEKDKIALSKAQQELQEALSKNADENSAHIRLLRERVKTCELRLNQSRENRFTAKRNTAFLTCYALGGIIAVAGLAFPPLILVGAAIISITAIVNFFDKRNKFGISRRVASLGERIKNFFLRLKSPSSTATITSMVKHSANPKITMTQDTAHMPFVRSKPTSAPNVTAASTNGINHFSKKPANDPTFFGPHGNGEKKEVPRETSLEKKHTNSEDEHPAVKR